MIHPERIQKLNNLPNNKNGNYVVYWMQSSHRVEYNHALEFAIEEANKLQKPLIVYFGLVDNFTEANERHYYFMLEGLKEIDEKLRKRGIKFVVQNISPELGALKLAEETTLLVVDRGC